MDNYDLFAIYYPCIYSLSYFYTPANNNLKLSSIFQKFYFSLIVHKHLVKGSGYHIDMNLLGLFGLIGGKWKLYICISTRSHEHLIQFKFTEHWFILLFCFEITGTFGLPFLCGATVRSVTHVNALCVYSKTYAPGEKPALEYIIEQRVTAICVYLLLGSYPINVIYYHIIKSLLLFLVMSPLLCHHPIFHFQKEIN